MNEQLVTIAVRARFVLAHDDVLAMFLESFLNFL